jgi:NTP pyrophosphatase (non-canonical NTP hydrolase)
MDLTQLQAEVAPWVRRNFSPTSLVLTTLGLTEEAGECARAVLKDAQRIRGTHEEWMAELEKELGDVLIKAADVADQAGLDLQTAIDKRWAEVSVRDWKADRQGHGLPT